MNKKIDIQTKVEQAMQSLDGMQSATPGAFFFTRVQGRLSRVDKNVWERVSAFIARPAVAFSLIFLVILMNGFVVFNQRDIISSNTEQEQVNYYDDITMASNSFYDYEITEP